MNNKIALVTAIGTITATAIVIELRRLGRYEILGTDINPANEIATSKDVDGFFQFPSAVADENSYLEYVLRFCKLHHVEYYFAVIDEEVTSISKNRDRFSEIGVKLCIPNHDLIMTCHYKNTFSEWISRNLPEIAIKGYQYENEIEDNSFPVFVKPIEGRASIGCKVISTRQELNESLRNGRLGIDIILQEFVTGEIITVDVVRNAKTGQSAQVQRKELQRNGNGCGISVVTMHDSKLAEICEKIAVGLDLNGVINIEFFSTNDGFRIIEINPRFSAGTTFSCLAGCNLVLNAIKIADQEKCEIGEITVGRHYARRYEVYEL